jgi:uncharacterized protein YunC (DUF1805 family)
MPIIEGTAGQKTWTGSYSFAVDGGATSTIVLRSNDGQIPNGAVVTGGYLDVTTQFTTGTSATGALQVNAANDLVSATIVSGAPFSTTGVKDIVPDATGSTAIKTTAARSPSFLIGTGTVTAGAFTLVLFYK